ncbi:MAG: cadherin-like domain-containing protein [Verrucomicrobiales bacterium]|nr:cadherin-like domain-containing protein [Verrucomicrobiales bacterium]
MNRNSHTNIAKLWVAVALLFAGLGSFAAPYFSNSFTSGFQNSGVIPDGSLNGWSDTRTVSGSGVHHVSDVRVALTLSGGDNGDLYAYLVHTNGLAVLLNRVGLASTNAFGADHDGFNVTFSAAGSQNIHFYEDHSPSYDGAGRLTGTWQPDGRAIDPLSTPADFDAAGSAGFGALSGLDPHGDWTLFIADVSSGGGTSTVVAWSLEIDAVTEPPSQLAITSINGGASVTAGTPFSVEIRALDVNGEFSNVGTNTAVSLSLDSGNGTLGGTLSGTITNGTSTLTLSGATYSRAESGVALTATRDSGDNLASADSSTFAVSPGSFAKLQVLMPGQSANPGSATGKTGSPGQQTVGVALTVTVRAVDAHRNLVTNVTDTVALTSSDAGASLPANAALVGGTGDFNLTFYTAGTPTVTASDASQPSITADTGSATTVVAGTQTITFTSPGDTTYGVDPVGLVATSTSGLTVSFAVVSGPATLTSNTNLVITGAGSVTLRASQAGNSSWNAASPVDRTISVAAKSVTPGIVASDKVYDGDDSATLASRSLSGVINDDAVDVAGGTAAFADAAVGQNKTVIATGLSLTGADAGNYLLSSTSATNLADITAAEVTVVSGLSANSKAYDATNTATISSNTVVLAGIVSADLSTVHLSTNGYSASFDSAALGSGKTVTVTGLTLTGSGASNYALTQPELSADIYPGAVAQLAFVTQPDGAAAGSPFTQQPVLHTRDAYGNDSTNGLPGSLTVALTLSSGTGTLQGTTQLDIGSTSGRGTVSFLDLRIDAWGSKVLTAAASGLTNAESATFVVANLAPEVASPTFARGPNVTLKILISNLLTNATDLNGDALALSAVSATSTNGAVLRTNATYLLYSLPPGGNVADAFTYTVTDGVTSSTGTVHIVIQPDPSGLTANLVAYGVNALGQPTMTFAGVPGYHYLVQRATSLTEPTVWTGLETLLTPAGGLFQYTDTNAPVGMLFYRAINQ